ncbi:MAG: alpha amylase C-terminal domain-containing protein, partial [Culicoidibacterales bacterium]
SEEHRIVLINFSNQEFTGPMGVPAGKGYIEVFHSYREMENGILPAPKAYAVGPEPCDNYRQRIEVTIPAYTTIYLQPQL